MVKKNTVEAYARITFDGTHYDMGNVITTISNEDDQGVVYVSLRLPVRIHKYQVESINDAYKKHLNTKLPFFLSWQPEGEEGGYLEFACVNMDCIVDGDTIILTVKTLSSLQADRVNIYNEMMIGYRVSVAAKRITIGLMELSHPDLKNVISQAYLTVFDGANKSEGYNIMNYKQVLDAIADVTSQMEKPFVTVNIDRNTPETRHYQNAPTGTHNYTNKQLAC